MKVIIISNWIINDDYLLIQVNLINILFFKSNMTKFFFSIENIKWSQE